MSIHLKILKYMNMVDLKKRIAIKNKLVYYHIAREMFFNLPACTRKKGNFEALKEVLLEHYLYDDKLGIVKNFNETDFLMKDSLKDIKFDDTSFKIIIALIRSRLNRKIDFSGCDIKYFQLSYFLMLDFSKVNMIILSDNLNVNDYLIKVLESCDSLVGLKYFYINNTGLTAKGILKLSKSPKFINLVELNIRIPSIKNQINLSWFSKHKSLLSIYVYNFSCLHFSNLNDERVIFQLPEFKKKLTDSVYAKNGK